MNKEEQILKELTEIIKKYDLTIFGGKEGILFYSNESKSLEGEGISIDYNDNSEHTIFFE